MPLEANQAFLIGNVQWAYEKTNTGFSPATQGEPLTWRQRPSGNYNHTFAAEYTISAAGTQAVDLYGPFTNLAVESVTGSQVMGGWLYVTGEGGVLEMEPHGTDPLEWPTSGTLTFTPGATGSGACWADGVTSPVTSSARQWLLTNSGASPIAVKLVVFVSSFEFAFRFDGYWNSGYLAAI